MSRQTLCQERLQQWMAGLQLPAFDDPRRPLEEMAYRSLLNFFALLLASRAEPPEAPMELLDPAELSGWDRYSRLLSLPLQGTPEPLVRQLELGRPSSELFALQRRLSDQLDDEGRAILLQFGRLH